VLPYLRASTRSSDWIFESLQDLARYPGFGPHYAGGGFVTTLNLPPGRDATIDVEKSEQSAIAAYGDSVIPFVYQGTGHGLVDIDAAAIADQLNALLGYYKALFNLS
jgi:hypothetical protein